MHAYIAAMGREFLTAAERIAWAIEHSGRNLTELGQAIGCTHATLSQWQNGHTPIERVKVGLLMHFAEETRTSLRWLLYGDGPRTPDDEGDALRRVGTALRAMEERAPWKVEPIVSMVEAAARAERPGTTVAPDPATTPRPGTPPRKG